MKSRPATCRSASRDADSCPCPQCGALIEMRSFRLAAVRCPVCSHRGWQSAVTFRSLLDLLLVAFLGVSSLAVAAISAAGCSWLFRAIAGKPGGFGFGMVVFILTFVTAMAIGLIHMPWITSVVVKAGRSPEEIRYKKLGYWIGMAGKTGVMLGGLFLTPGVAPAERVAAVLFWIAWLVLFVKPYASWSARHDWR